MISSSSIAAADELSAVAANRAANPAANRAANRGGSRGAAARSSSDEEAAHSEAELASPQAFSSTPPHESVAPPRERPSELAGGRFSGLLAYPKSAPVSPALHSPVARQAYDEALASASSPAPAPPPPSKPSSAQSRAGSRQGPGSRPEAGRPSRLSPIPGSEVGGSEPPSADATPSSTPLQVLPPGREEERRSSPEPFRPRAGA